MIPINGLIFKGRTRIFSGGKLILWSQNKCKKCQRFLSKNQIEFCDRCAKKSRLESHRKSVKKWLSNNENKEQELLRWKVYYNAERFNVGDIF